MTALEKAARALVLAKCGLAGLSREASNHQADNTWTEHVYTVRAVLMAVRGESGDAAMCAEIPLGPMHRYGQWVAAIDAILNEEPK